MGMLKEIELEESKLVELEKELNKLETECAKAYVSLVGRDVTYTDDSGVETKYKVTKDSFENHARQIKLSINQKTRTKDLDETKTINFMGLGILEKLSFENAREMLTPYINLWNTAENVRKQKEKISDLQKEAEETERQIRELNAIVKYLKEERGVKYLVHFTQVKNLDNIAKYGILTYLEQVKQKVNSETSDDTRIDGIQHSNFSISFPNCALLYRKINTEKCNMCILKIDIDVLMEESLKGKFSFTAHNASYKDPQEKTKKGLEAVKRMFSEELEYDGALHQRCSAIPLNQTTDYQAEVLISGNVPCNYIKEIVIYPGKNYSYDKAKRLFPEIPVKYEDRLFQNRPDLSTWLRREREEWNDNHWYDNHWYDYRY